MIFESKAPNAIYTVKGSILDYSQTLEDGVHYATVLTSDNIEGSDMPELGRGFIVEIHRYRNVIHIYATQYVTNALKRFCRKYYTNAWSEWIEL